MARWKTLQYSESFETISKCTTLRPPKKEKPANQLALIAGLFGNRFLIAGRNQLRNEREGRRIREARRRAFRWMSRGSFLRNVFAVRNVLRVRHVL
jgi:hypothetical protein